MRIRPSVALATALLLPGCACKKPELPENIPLAKVGGITISRKEFDQKLRNVSADYRNYVLSPAGRKQFLEVLVREKLVICAAREAGFQNTKEYRQEVDSMKSDMDARLDEYRNYLLTKNLITKLKSDGTIGVAEEDIRKYYNEHPQIVSISHILLDTQEQAEKVLAGLRSGRQFQRMAVEFSTDPETGPSGGTIPPFIYGEFLPEIETAVAGMKDGETAGPVKSKFGYHIIKRNWARKISLNDAKGRIAKILEKNKMDAYLGALAKKYKVEVLDDKNSDR